MRCHSKLGLVVGLTWVVTDSVQSISPFPATQALHPPWHNSGQVTGVYSRKRDGEMEPLPEPVEHDEGFGGERAGGDGAVGALITPRGALAAKATPRHLPARAPVTTDPRHTAALTPIPLAALACGGVTGGARLLIHTLDNITTTYSTHWRVTVCLHTNYIFYIYEDIQLLFINTYCHSYIDAYM